MLVQDCRGSRKQGMKMTTSVPDSHSKAMDQENKKLHIILTSSPQIKVDLFDCKKVKNKHCTAMLSNNNNMENNW